MSTPENTLRDILHTAVQRESDAQALYTRAAKLVKGRNAKSMLQELATQEVGHRTRLEALLAGNVFRVLTKTQQKKVVDLKITDFLVEAPLAADSDIQDILIVAGKRERGSYELYASLAKVARDSDSVKLFEFLAAEEATHKLRVEKLYEELMLKDN